MSPGRLGPGQWIGVVMDKLLSAEYRPTHSGAGRLGCLGFLASYFRVVLTGRCSSMRHALPVALTLICLSCSSALAEDICRLDFDKPVSGELFTNSWGDKPVSVLGNGVTGGVAHLKLQFGAELKHKLSYWRVALPAPVPVLEGFQALSFRVKTNVPVAMKVPISPYGFIYHGPGVKASPEWQTVTLDGAQEKLAAWCARSKKNASEAVVSGFILGLTPVPGVVADVHVDEVVAVGPDGVKARMVLEARKQRFRRIRASVVTLPWSDEGRSLDYVLDRLDEAGLAGESDIVCLPMECVKTDGESIPGGPLSTAIAAKAKEYGMYVIGNLREMDGDKVYVTSFLCDRKGAIVGKYRKSHKMPDEDMALGDELPVFDTDFGKIAMRIGSDRYFPEIDLVYTTTGARMIFWSQMPEPVEDEHLQDYPAAGRASDYRVFIACARYSRAEKGWITSKFPPYRGSPIGRSYLINCEGQRIASTPRKGSVATAVIPMGELRGRGRKVRNWAAFTALADPVRLPEKREWAKRKVRVTVIENHVGVNDLCRKLDKAGEMGSDIVCTYEFVWVPVHGATPSPEKVAKLCAEAIKKRARVAAKAKQWNMYVLLCGIVRDRRTNEAILYDRNGREVSRYTKIGTTYPEQIPGTEAPILETDFGRIGVKICVDQYMAEIDRCYGIKGADILFFSTQDWGPDAIWRNFRDISRSMDSQYFHVQATHSCSEAMHRSMIVDPAGIPVASSRLLGPGIVSAVIDLDKDRPRRYVRNFKPHTPKGYLPQYQSTEMPEVRNDLRDTLLAQRRPGLYQALKVDHTVPQPKDSEYVVIENRRCRMILKPEAVWVALIDKESTSDMCYMSSGKPLVDAVINGARAKANSVAFDGKKMTVGFPGHDTKLIYEVDPADDWILFKLVSIEGTRPSRLTLFRAPVIITETVGRQLAMARNAKTGVCLMAANMQSKGQARSRGGWTELAALTQDAPGPRLEGAAVALIVAPSSELHDLLRDASIAFKLPTNMKDGVPAKEAPIAKRPYWFVSIGEKDVDKMIDYCNRSGVKQVLITFGAWSSAAGHYPINLRNYPNGLASLKSTVDRFHAAGIAVGMHTFASKVKKTDSYVTPIPDKRFWTDMKVTLAADVTAEQTEIRMNESLAEWPGSPVCKRKSWEGGIVKHQEVIIDGEIVRYETIGPKGKYDTFMECKRGAWKTTAGEHKAGAQGLHFGVDGCINGYIIDQETDLLDEVTTKLAAIFNHCDFDMIYFDGGEDVPKTRFDYYVTKNQALTMSKIKRRPLVHLGTIMTHGLWHSFSLAGTADHYMNTRRSRMISMGGASDLERIKEVVDGVVLRTVEYELQGKRERWCSVKDHIDYSVRRAVAMEAALMPSELGWFGIWPPNKYSDGLQLDEAEYLMVKSLAYDQPISIQASFAQIEQHSLGAEVLDIFRTYEEMRASRGKIDAATLASLRELGKDFVMLRRAGKRSFVPVTEVPDVAGSKDKVRAFVGTLGDAAVATVWHITRDGKLTLAVDPGKVTALSFAGKPLPLEKKDGKVVVQVGNQRTTLVFDGLSADAVRTAFENGIFVERPAAMVWVQAEAFVASGGEMAKGSTVGVQDKNAVGDVVVCTGAPNREQAHGWFCEYSVEIPHKALWNFWGRVRYPSGNDDSCWLVPGAKEMTSAGRVVLGNCGVTEKKWHWTGTGAGSIGVPPGRPIRMMLPAGKFTFRIYAREGPGTAEENPRVDCFCITEDPLYVPTDGDARKVLK